MARDPLLGKVLVGRYEVVERIGEGGTGVVYRARQSGLDREVAIKVLGAHVASDPEWIKRFENEARAAAKLHDRNTVQTYEFGQTPEGQYYLAMELLHGQELRREIDTLGRIPPQRALRIIIQACSSVGEAHSNGIIHRDLKPDNLFLCDHHGPGDLVKVLDFSVAKMQNADALKTRAGIVLGTPSYISPEQAQGSQLGPHSDVYSLGVVLYEMLSGRPPFTAPSPMDVLMMHIRDRAAPLHDTPPQLNGIVQKALEKDPSRRYARCEDLAADCEMVLAELFPRVTPSGMRQVAPPAGGFPSQPAAQPQVVDARTVMADASGSAAARSPGGAAGEPKTVIADGSLLSPPGAGRQAAPEWRGSLGSSRPEQTMVLPDSSGVVAFARAQVEQARQAAVAESMPMPEATPWFFWLGWAILGIGLGISIHFILAHRALSGG